MHTTHLQGASFCFGEVAITVPLSHMLLRIIRSNAFLSLEHDTA